MSKANKILMGLVIVLAVVLVALLVGRNWMGTPRYTAVYLRTGELYFGKLVRFPHFGLRQVYLLQVNQANQQSPVSVQRFVNVFWGPEDYIKINRNEVVWIAKLNSEGQLAQLLKTNPNLIPPQENPPMEGVTPSPSR